MDDIHKQIMEKLTNKLRSAISGSQPGDPSIPAMTLTFTQAEMDTQLDSGMGLDKPLKPYSKPYELFKQSTGRGSIVNHTFSGQMRNSMTVIDKTHSAEIIFTGGNADKAYHTNKLRKWIGLGNVGAQKVAKAIAALILKRLQK